MKRQIRCKCGCETPDNNNNGKCSTCTQREVGMAVKWNSVTGVWEDLKEGDFVRLVYHPGVFHDHAGSGFSMGNVYEVVNRGGTIGISNEDDHTVFKNVWNLQFVFETLAPDPNLKLREYDSTFHEAKNTIDQLAELCIETKASVLMYVDNGKMRYQVNLYDESQTEVDTVDEVIEILAIVKVMLNGLQKWGWV